jgi:hypothetical protein
VDRGHRELPIRADYVGRTLSTSHDEAVKVLVREEDGRDEIVLKKRGRGARATSSPPTSKGRTAKTPKAPGKTTRKGASGRGAKKAAAKKVPAKKATRKKSAPSSKKKTTRRRS